MKKDKQEQIKQTMLEISKNIELDKEKQELGNIIFYEDFQFGRSGLGKEEVYVVEIKNKEENKIKTDKETNEDNEVLEDTTYHIYDKDQNLIATVDLKGKVHFTDTYLEELKNIDEKYYERLDLEEIDFELPEEIKENDLVMTKEEIQEYADKDLSKSEKENSKDKEQETEEEKKSKTAETLGINKEEIRGMSTINPREKITDEYNLIDLMPEAAGYEEISIVCTRGQNKNAGQFTVLGKNKDGELKEINSIESIEGTSTNKDVISINEDGTEVEEKQVNGLMRINSRNGDDGIAVSIGDYGMMDVDYVSDIMDKENRRVTPIRTKELENQRIATAKVRENAGDSIDEVEKEGKNFRENKEDGVNPQSLDGIDIDQADGKSMTLEELKEYIKEEALDKGDMSRDEMDEFIKSEIYKSGLELSEAEVKETTQDIREDVVDESRFPSKEDRRYQ